MPDPNAPEVPMAGGAVTSSAVAPLHLIPTEPLIRLAYRFQAGIDRKGEDKAWNAVSQNQACLTDRKFILDRISHVIAHANKLRDRLVRGEALLDGDDDAGAVIWGGAFLCSATRAIADARPPLNCSACGGTGKFPAGKRDCPACSGTGKVKPYA